MFESEQQWGVTWQTASSKISSGHCHTLYHLLYSSHDSQCGALEVSCHTIDRVLYKWLLSEYRGRTLQKGIKALDLPQRAPARTTAAGLLRDPADEQLQAGQIGRLLVLCRQLGRGETLLDRQVDIVHRRRQVDVVLLCVCQ